METKKPEDFPKDGSAVKFTDLQGIERKGIYKKESNGYMETTELEMPGDNELIYPEEEIRSWEYIEEKA